jgi:phosphatidylglycerophosphate synthase
LPASVTPLRLTKVGVIGAVIAAAALIGCRWSPAWLPVFVTGMFLNWLGMALDGPLARSRNKTNRKFDVYGQANDLLSHILLIVTFGASPFLSFQSAFVILVCYLLFSAYSYVRTIAHHARPMAYIGLGPSEFRILMAAWPLVARVMGVDEIASDGPSRLDTAILILAAIAVIGLAAKALADAGSCCGGMTSSAPCRLFDTGAHQGKSAAVPRSRKAPIMCYSRAEE